MFWLLQDIAGKDVMDQFETIMRKHKLNPVSNNPMKLFQARKRAKRALKTAVGALQGEWDESQIIHVSARPYCHLFRPARTLQAAAGALKASGRYLGALLAIPDPCAADPESPSVWTLLLSGLNQWQLVIETTY